MEMAARRASRKAAWRLIPFLILCLTAEMFRFSVGVFFFGYFIFEVPSNLILERVGARRWIARIMIRPKMEVVWSR